MDAEDSNDYRLLADKIIELFNPPDKDEGEVSILMDTITLAAKVLLTMRCMCDPAPDAWDERGEEAACQRCLALGRFQDAEVSR